MMPRLRYHILLLVAMAITLAVPSLARAAGDPGRATVSPVPQPHAWWAQRHEQKRARLRQGRVELLFIGDSITQGWEDAGRRIWAEYYGQRRAVNLGFAGDRTEHVLWRLHHGELEGISPKVAVVMIGTNNMGSHGDSPEETAAGVHAILTMLRARLPDTKILLLGVFPCSAAAADPFRRSIVTVNDRLRTFADRRHIFYVDLSRRFLDDQGRLSPVLMPDFLHPSEEGYRVWASGMEDSLRELMGEQP